MELFHTENYTFNPNAIPVAICAVAILSLGLLVLEKNPASKINRSFLFFTSPIFIWLIGYAFSYHANNPQTSLTWARGAYLGVVFISPGVFYFVTVLTRVERPWRLFTRISFLISGLFLPLAFFHPLFISGTELHSWGYYPRYGPIGALFLIAFFTPMLTMFYLLKNAIGKEIYTPRQQRQFRIVLLGLLVAYTGAVDYLPKFGVDIYPAGYISILLFVAMTSYAILRHGLFTITPAIAAPVIMTTMADSLLVADQEGNVVIANDAATSTLGLPIASIVGRPLGDFFPKADLLLEKSRILGPTEQILSVDEETTLLTRGKKEIPVSLSAGVIRSAEGHLVGITAVCHHLGKIKAQFSLIEHQKEVLSREVAERIRAEEGLRVLNETLEQRVAERTSEANHRAEALARANAELERFSSAASHDLQEPLRTVISFLSLLEKRYKGKFDADADEFIHFATEGASWMQILVDDLLVYSRITGRPVSSVATDSMEAVNGMLAHLKVAISESGTTVTLGCLPMVMADKTELMELFQNLIGNAIKFRSEAPPSVRISAERSAETAEWRFSVSDNGIGIKPEYLEKIFVIFQRLHTKREIPGTGVGLAICQKIVERHGGRIWVESTLGRGSTFYFTLPAIEGSHKPATS